MTVGPRTGVLPIIDADGARVATLTWSGTMWSGEGRWTWTASDEIAATLDRVRRDRADLERVDLATPDRTTPARQPKAIAVEAPETQLPAKRLPPM